jgi:surface polysaccharide O-acyltransferase-like enzyme
MEAGGSQTGGAPRIRGLDAARVLASLATVLYHATASGSAPDEGAGGRWGGMPEALRFAVAYFSMVAAYFLVSSLRRRVDRPYGAYALSRVKRLYLPFLGWSLVYLAFSKASVLITRARGEHAEFSWEILLEGTNYVLWFLPYLLVMTVAAFPVVRWAVRSRGREVAVGTACVAVGVVVSLLTLRGELEDLVRNCVGRQLELPFIMSKSWARSPSFLWGLGLALLWRGGAPGAAAGERGDGARLGGAMVALGVALMAACGAVNVLFEHMNAMDNLMGVGLFLIALGPTPLQRHGGLATLGPLTYGVYLSHQVFVLSLQRLMPVAGLEPSRAMDLGVFVVSAAAAIALTMAIRRCRWTRWMAP